MNIYFLKEDIQTQMSMQRWFVSLTTMDMRIKMNKL